MVASCSVNVYDVLDCYCSLIRRNPDRDELGDEIARVDVKTMTAKSLLVNSVDNFRTSFRILAVGHGVMFQMWSYRVDRCEFIIVILTMFKPDGRVG